MSLVSDLQRNAMPGPTSRQFNITAWRTLAARDGLSDDDRRVIDVGVFVYEVLSKIRGDLSFVTDKRTSLVHRRVLLLGVANREALATEVKAARDLLERARANGGIGFDDMASYKLSLVAGEFTPEEISDTALEASAALIRMLVGEPECEGDGAEVSLDAMAADLNLAIAYQNTEDLWQDVLWHGYRRLDEGESAIFVPVDTSVQSMRAAEFHRHRAVEAHRRHIAELRAIADLPGNGDPSSRKNARGEIDRLLVGLDVRRATGIPTYYAEKASEASPRFGNLTLALVMGAFDVLTMIAHAKCVGFRPKLEAEFFADGPAVHPAYFAWPIPKGELLGNLADMVDVEPRVASELLDFLTFGKAHHAGPKEDFWIAPCLEIDDEYIGIASHSLRNGNIAYQANAWLRRLGFDLDFKGIQFEEFARQTIAHALSDSLLARTSLVHSSGFKFTTSERLVEEIDLLLLVGVTLLVCELKCYLTPIEGRDWANHDKKLESAAIQAARKARAVEGSMSEFRRRAIQVKLHLPSEVQVVPLVVLDSAIGAGRTLHEVDVVDLSMLAMFLGGSMITQATLMPDGSLTDPTRVDFYQSAEEGAAVLREYLRAPPQVASIKAAVTARDIATHASRNGPHLFAIRKFEVEGL